MEKQGEKATMVLIPAPVIGHLNPMIELAKHLLQRYANLSITIIIMTTTAAPISEETHLSHMAKGDSSITFLHLPFQPQVQHHPLSSFSTFSSFIDNNYQAVSDAVSSIAASPNHPKLAALIIDMVCTKFVDLAQLLHLPIFLFFTSSVNFLSLFLNIHSILLQPALQLPKPPYLSNISLEIPGLSLPLPASALPKILFDKEGEILPSLTNAVERIRRIDGIMVNTFYELEPYAIQFMKASNNGFPPVCAVGPLLDMATTSTEESPEEDEIASWLDSQPDSSVLFLCFGSRGSFPPEQVKEIAKGIELSGFRFLWSLRRPPNSGGEKEGIFPTDYTEVGDALDRGFLERTEGRGRVIGFSPQTVVLRHKAVGGFVSHCGWNSLLESLWCGVPVAALPLYAEQEINAFFLVEEMGLGVRIERLEGEEMAKGIRSVMEEGEVREKVKRMKMKAREATVEGGLSYLGLGNLVDDAVRRAALASSSF